MTQRLINFIVSKLRRYTRHKTVTAEIIEISGPDKQPDLQKAFGPGHTCRECAWYDDLAE